MIKRCPFCGEEGEVTSCRRYSFSEQAYSITCKRFSNRTVVLEEPIPEDISHIFHRIVLEKNILGQILWFCLNKAEQEPPGHKDITYYETQPRNQDDIFQKIDKILLNIHAMLNEPISFSYSAFGEVLLKNIFFADDLDEIKATIRIMENMGYITTAADDFVDFTKNGYKRLYKIKKEITRSKKCFVAMWFDPTQDQVYSAIEKAIIKCGYEAIRIDKKEHNKQIVPEIFYDITNSDFMVAELTGNRNGVIMRRGLQPRLEKK